MARKNLDKGCQWASMLVTLYMNGKKILAEFKSAGRDGVYSSRKWEGQMGTTTEES